MFSDGGKKNSNLHKKKMGFVLEMRALRELITMPSIFYPFSWHENIEEEQITFIS